MNWENMTTEDYQYEIAELQKKIKEYEAVFASERLSIEEKVAIEKNKLAEREKELDDFYELLTKDDLPKDENGVVIQYLCEQLKTTLRNSNTFRSLQSVLNIIISKR